MTGRNLGAAAAAVLTAAALAGCVNVPAGGGVSVTKMGGSSVQPGLGLQVVPAPPARDWSPPQIVSGFLAASGASLTGSSTTGSGLSASSFAVARLYLSDKFRRSWHPSSPTVIDAMPNIRELSPNAQNHLAPPAVAYVDVTSQHVEMLQSPGNIVVSPTSHVYQFALAQQAGQWRIDSISADGAPDSRVLLLLRTDFARDYQPRDLYFFPDTGPPTTLVPDPVFIPQQQGTQGSVRALVAGLFQPAGWLQGAVWTAFDRGTTIDVQVSGPTAIVRLGGAASRASPAAVREMAAQLVWTLTRSPYSGPSGSPPGPPTGTGIESVELLVGHRRPILELPPSFAGYMSPWMPSGDGQALYFQPADPGGPPRMAVITPGSAAPEAVPLPPGTGIGPFTAIAGSAAGSPAGLLAACRDRTVYLMPARRAATATTLRLPAACTSLAWDDRGDLWATAGNGAWVLPPVRTVAGAVRHGAFTAALSEPGQLSGLSVAPDGVRVAMIERTHGGGQILVAAISSNGPQVFLAASQQTVRVGSDIAKPVALAWRRGDQDYLLAVGRQASGQLQLFSVPLNGGDSVLQPSLLPRGATWLQAMRPDIIVGTATARGTGPGEILTSPSVQNGTWHRLAIGSTPVVPG